MKEWLYELLEKLTGKHYHIFDKPSQIEYLDGTQFFIAVAERWQK